MLHSNICIPGTYQTRDSVSQWFFLGIFRVFYCRLGISLVLSRHFLSNLAARASSTLPCGLLLVLYRRFLSNLAAGACSLWSPISENFQCFCSIDETPAFPAWERCMARVNIYRKVATKE